MSMATGKEKAKEKAKHLIANHKIQLVIGCTIISVPADYEWQMLFDRPFTHIDALKMTYEELCGTDYFKRIYFQPTWHKDSLETKTLVIDNFADIPPNYMGDKTAAERDFGKEAPAQIDYLFMCRASTEIENSHSLNSRNMYFVDKDVAVYIIHRPNHAFEIIQPIRSRAKFVTV